VNRATLARRYAPLAAVVAIQLLIIATVPSTAPSAQDVAAGAAAGSEVDGGTGGYTDGPGFTSDGTEVTGDGTVATGTGGTGVAGGGAVGGNTAGGVATGGTAGGDDGTSGTGAGASGVTGDTSHCKDGRQFDPAIFYYAPRCVGKWAGGNNGGATYQGVTDKEIKVIVYRGKPNPQVDAILDVLGANPDEAWERDFMDKAFQFMNQAIELYGRKLVWKEIRGSCDTVPPNYTCLRGEMRDIVRDEKPFAVIWNTILASPAFDELSALKVINIGGQHFRNNPFSIQRRPYHWDVTMPGDVLAKYVAEWYCKRLHGRKAKWAGTTGTDARSQNPPTNDIRNKDRVLGVISTDDPENLNMVKQVLKPELAKCGASVSHEFYYAQDIARAEEQRRLGIQKMRESPESTTIMCFCDAVAPLFLYRTAQEQAYFPEHIVVGAGTNDSDAVGQSYDAGSTLCPDCHQYENAFGIRTIPQLQRFTNNEAVRLYRMMGGKLFGNGANEKQWDTYKTALTDLNYYMLLGNLLQGAGPLLTPANVEKGAFSAGLRGGFADINDSHFNARGFKPGNYGWFNDVDQVYWSQTARSESMGNNKGAYVQIDGRRFLLGELPEGEPDFPNTKPR
jgi:hypothetical protein